MTAGLTYGVTGKMFIGPITAIDGTGGEEILAVEGRRFVMDTGFVLERVRDQRHTQVVKRMVGPGLLDVPMHDVDDAAMQEILSPLWDTNGVNPDGSSTPDTYRKLAANVSILILPLAATDGASNAIRAIYLKAAMLDPDSQSNYNMSADAPLTPGITRFVATSEQGDDGNPPYMIKTPAEIASVYFP